MTKGKNNKKGSKKKPLKTMKEKKKAKNEKKNKKIETKSSLQQLGEDLRALRKAQGMTLQALAEASGKSVSFLSKIERGLARPSITALQDIAEALKMPIGWFFQNDGPVPAEERPYIVRAKRPHRRPVVLPRGEVQRMLALIHGTNGLVAELWPISARGRSQ